MVAWEGPLICGLQSLGALVWESKVLALVPGKIHIQIATFLCKWN